MGQTNYYRQEYQKNDGSRGSKEFTSTTKSSTQLGREAKEWCRQHGYKPTSGSAGTK